MIRQKSHRLLGTLVITSIFLTYCATGIAATNVDVPAGTVTLDLSGSPIPAGAVTHFAFDETSGSTASNSVSPGTRDGTLANFAGDDSHWKPNGGAIKGALDLDGSNDFVNISGYKGVSDANPRTIAAWIQTSDTAAPIVSWGKAWQ